MLGQFLSPSPLRAACLAALPSVPMALVVLPFVLLLTANALVPPPAEAAVPPPLNAGPYTQEGFKIVDARRRCEPCQYKGKGAPTAPIPFFRLYHLRHGALESI